MRRSTSVTCTGATHAYFGHDDWAAHAPGLKTLDDALAIRRRILTAFERAEAERDPARLRQQHVHVAVALHDAADGRGDVGRGQPGGGDLVEQRLEDVMIPPIQQRHAHRCAAERPRRVQSAEPAADDDDVREGVAIVIRREIATGNWRRRNRRTRRMR